VLAAIGCVSLPGLLITDAYDLALAQELPRATSAPIADQAHGYALASIISLPGVIGTILGSVLVTIAAARAGAVPVAAPVLMLLGWIVPQVAYEPVLTIGGGMLLVAGSAVAAAALTRPAAGAAPVPAPAS
jgi:hypothetical protein